MRVSIVGLGKLGSPLAAVLASKGHDVVGVDLNPRFVEAINEGRAPVEEPRLQEFVDRSRGRLRATVDCGAAVLASDATFVIVPTPSDASGAFSNRHVLSAMQQVGEALRQKGGYHLVVITSTVMPGSTGGEIRQALEHHSGREVGETLGLCYNPEFIALGSVIRDMLRPDFILIGESDAKAGDILETIYKGACENDPPMRRMNFVNAELTKISVNTFVTTKISYANMLADLCDRLPGADVDVVSNAVGSDTRIGAKYLRGAMGYGGPCFPRDNVAFSTLARQLGAKADLAEATDRTNRYQIGRLAAIVEKHLPAKGVIGIVGLSYKPGTGVVEESQSVQLAAHLAGQGHKVVVYDPQATGAALAMLAHSAEAAESLEACARQVDLLVVATPWPEFRELSPAWLARSHGRVAVIDLWRLLPPEAFEGVARLIHVGKGEAPAEAAAAAVRIA